MTFNNNVLVNYTFNGPGQITGATGFTKKNSGTVTFNNTNTFTGTANISNGTVVVGSGGSLADASYVVSAGAALTVNGSLAAAAITNDGTISVGSTGTLDPTTTLSNVITSGGSASVTLANAAQTLATISGNGSITLTGTALTITGTSQYDGAIGGTGSIITGASETTLTLSQANNYGGGTTIVAGTTLAATNTTGSATGTGTTTVNGTLTGTGAIGGPIVVNAGGTMRVSGANTWGSSVALSGTLSPFGAGVAGSIKLGGTTVSNGATLTYDFGNLATSDTVSVPSLSTSGTVTLNVNGLPGFGTNAYPLFTSTATISDSATYTIVPQGALAGFPASDFSVTHDSTHVFLNVNLANTTTVIWRGTSNSNWNTTDTNWLSGNSMFANGNAAQFDDSNTSGRTTIAVDAAGVNPVQTIFNNSSAGPDPTYTINGPGALGGILLSMTGTGTAILNNTTNGILGQTSITNGTLAIAADGSLGPAPVNAIANQLVINGGQLMTLATTTLSTTRGIQIGNAAGHIGAVATTGATINVDTTAGANTTTYNGIIADVTTGGILNKTGAGELDLGGANTFSGGMNINAGTVKLTASGAGGTGRITVNTNGVLALANDVPVTVPTAPAVLTPPIATPITISGGVLGTSGAQGTVHVIQSDMTIAAGTTATIDLFDPTGPANNTNTTETILGVQNLTNGVQTSAYGTLHGSGNIFVQQQTGVTTPDNQAFRLRGPASPDYTGTITVGQARKFEVQNSTGTPGSPAGTGLIVLTGGTINSLLTTTGGGPGTTGSFSLFNVRNNFTVTPAAPTTVTFGNNVSFTGTGSSADEHARHCRGGEHDCHGPAHDRRSTVPR